MSLVGPRPPLPSEVERYGDDVRRRLLVKPGLTGLWQVSGRSDLSWEESVRLDLYYVENWSFVMDLMIMAGPSAPSSRGAGRTNGCAFWRRLLPAAADDPVAEVLHPDRRADHERRRHLRDDPAVSGDAHRVRSGSQREARTESPAGAA